MRCILPQRYEIVMPAIKQRAEICGAAGQTVIGGDRQHDWTFSAQMAFDRHGCRRVRQTVRQSGERIARAWSND